ncbi:hypothetical protein F3Y22_tig00111105pilonHSYRG00410 [Hibiscus syriacus]|uniref:Uncharacterized protein n=1 Tax=Hibiscus syriacus TaxID=106335 RepID=A0A6A2YZ05_HIBSY|nr:hypothetical protein F3Y22_tig00111105pilonHSYRG00410 [Hibiscus syriacus]
MGQPNSEIQGFRLEKGEASNVVFSTEAPLVSKESSTSGSCSLKKIKSRGAVSSHDWELAESLISSTDPQTLNDALCVTLDAIWFLGTQQEMYGITELIRKIIANGDSDFTRATLRTSFLASCVSACQSRTMSLADTVTVMAQW